MRYIKILILIFIVIVIAALGIMIYTYDPNESQNLNIGLTQLLSSEKPLNDNNSPLKRGETAILLSKIVSYYKGNGESLIGDSQECKIENLKIAKDEGIIQGYGFSNDDLCLCSKVTREEAFSMLCRTFHLNTDADVNVISPYADYYNVSYWAKDSVADIAYILYECNKDKTDKIPLFENGICPKGDISQDTMLKLIDTVANSSFNKYPYNKFNHIKKLISENEMLKKLVGFLLTSGIILITIIVQIYLYIKVKKEVIYIGYTSCGKTELSLKLPNPDVVINRRSVNPTRAAKRRRRIIKMTNSGYTYFNAATFDTPGSYDEAIRSMLSKKSHMRLPKIIILVVAHTKSQDKKVIDNNYMNEQLAKINDVYLPIIRDYASYIEKVLLFINKCDILPDKCDIDELYKEYIDLLQVKLENITDFKYVKGSALRNNNIKTLRNCL